MFALIRLDESLRQLFRMETSLVYSKETSVFERIRLLTLTATAGCAAAAAVALGAAPATAEVVDPSPYVVGDSVYFNANGLNCSIGPDGSAGCDVAPPQAVMWVSFNGARGQGIPWPYVPAIVVDHSGMPAHPDWSGGNKHTLPGGNPALVGAPFNPPTITWGGTNCFATYSLQMGCSAEGGAHGFYAGGGQSNGF
ncbi:hypothetical protein U3653_32145 [Nocardia sp. CDC186]|uniref:Secreted protein n=1 Tax=Nocardia implantans TaxID=3108168 RepID=A0ABU6B4I1_9NOCA|nr:MULTISPECIES: hypothetical protein [unclassified Nocardia]MBF6196186.1 hypothetical protein [Nocardia beijingensis]MEA3532826.1 hypothetical protein [Nocardia sp. CDC192]MEB3514698.1 hypothetical protein [Nocardia sp. CDC186]